jgi:hypothetical protein
MAGMWMELERQRRRAEAEAERRLIARAIGVEGDDDVVLDVLVAGYTSDTIVLLELAPPVQVAWADGCVSSRERELLMTIAAREHVTPNNPAYVHLDMWLHRPPSAHLFVASLRVIKAILRTLRPEVGAALRRKLIGDCATIAAASAGIPPWGDPDSNDEHQVVACIAGELS